MLEIILTREDANTEVALLTEWLAPDGAEVRKGDPVCVVETTKASLEFEAPGTGTLVHLYEGGAEVELGRTIALIAESIDELEEARARRDDTPSTPREATAPSQRKATKKAVELAERHGIDLDAIDKQGFITGEDVEALVAAQAAAEEPVDPVLAGVSIENVTLPASLALEETVGAVDETLLESLRTEPDGFRALSSEEKVAAYREHGAVIGEGVVLDAGTLIVAPRIVLGDGVRIGAGGTIECDEIAAIGAVTHFGPGLDLRCRRAFVGAGVHASGSIAIGGGGHRDPWATLTIGDSAFLGDSAFVNVCRPVLIGSEVFLTMRSMIVTHNIGHSLLEGFENRFAAVVLEDRSQIGLGTVVYAGCRVGREAIVASNSYVVSDIPAGALAIGVPAKAVGHAKRTLSRQQQAELARRMIDELQELIALRGNAVEPLAGVQGFAVSAGEARSHIVLVERLRAGDELPAGAAETVVLTLEYAGDTPPDGTAVIDLLGRQLHGTGGVALETVREFCRKRGIKLSPGPWRYPGGLI
jgi:acetyltransferase-like isoleucine patch superfamily enzyme